MAAKKRSNDPNMDGQDVDFNGEDRQDFYESEVDRYVETVERDLGEAFQRYGFTLYHSLPPVKQVQLAEKLGFLGTDAIAQFNLAGVAISEEDWNKAASHLQKALEMDGTFADAAYNLAIVYEKLDRKQDAINLWSRFQELSTVEDERRAVESHLAELRG